MEAADGHSEDGGGTAPASTMLAMTPSDVATCAPTARREVRRIFRADTRGTAAVELSLVALPFLALIIAALQIGLIFFSQSALEVATEKSSRLVLTGSQQSQGVTQQQFLATVCAKLPVILNNCSNLMVDAQVYTSFSSSNTSTPTITYNANGTVSNTWQYNIGGPNDIVVLRVMYLLPVVSGPLGFNLVNTSSSSRLLMATAVFKNEPYQ